MHRRRKPMLRTTKTRWDRYDAGSDSDWDRFCVAGACNLELCLRDVDFDYTGQGTHTDLETYVRKAMWTEIMSDVGCCVASNRLICDSRVEDAYTWETCEGRGRRGIVVLSNSWTTSWHRSIQKLRRVCPIRKIQPCVREVWRWSRKGQGAVWTHGLGGWKPKRRTF